MRVPSTIDDVYAIRKDPRVLHCACGKCPSVEHLLFVALVLICNVTMLCSSYAQSAYTAINGTITDPSGARIPDARIIVRNVDTNVERITASGSSGTYSITDLVPGKYSLRVSKDGFAAGEMTEILLQVNETATLDFRLHIGQRTKP